MLHHSKSWYFLEHPTADATVKTVAAAINDAAVQAVNLGEVIKNISTDLLQCNICLKIFYSKDDEMWHYETQYDQEDIF